MDMQRGLAPGARVTIRDEDWVIRRLDLSDDGGHALTCDGLSELMRGTSTGSRTTSRSRIPPRPSCSRT